MSKREQSRIYSSSAERELTRCKASSRRLSEDRAKPCLSSVERELIRCEASSKRRSQSISSMIPEVLWGLRITRFLCALFQFTQGLLLILVRLKCVCCTSVARSLIGQQSDNNVKKSGAQKGAQKFCLHPYIIRIILLLSFFN